MQFDAVKYDAMKYDEVWYDAVQCGAYPCSMMQCGDIGAVCGSLPRSKAEVVYLEMVSEERRLPTRSPPSCSSLGVVAYSRKRRRVPRG